VPAAQPSTRCGRAVQVDSTKASVEIKSAYAASALATTISVELFAVNVCFKFELAPLRRGERHAR
jgi:hypothetical protein